MNQDSENNPMDQFQINDEEEKKEKKVEKLRDSQ
jgi:hypothetical protein